MNRTRPQLRNLARFLILHETKGEQHSPALDLPVYRVCEKLRSHLSAFMGIGGYRELLTYALPRAAAEASWLSSLRVNADGSLKIPEEPQRQLNPRQILEGGVILVAELIVLLVAFIGETLTLSILREVWPEVEIPHSNLGNEEKHDPSA